MGWATDACISLCEGEVMQQRFRRNPDVTEADYDAILDLNLRAAFWEPRGVLLTCRRPPRGLRQIAVTDCGGD